MFFLWVSGGWGVGGWRLGWGMEGPKVIAVLVSFLLVDLKPSLFNLKEPNETMW